MAGKTTNTRNKNTAKSKNSGKNKKSSTAKKTVNKTAAKPKQSNVKRDNYNPETRRQGMAWIILGLAVLLFAIDFIKGEFIWLGMHNGMFGLFGICAYVLPLILIYVAVAFAFDKSVKSAKLNVAASVLFSWILSGIIHVFSDALEHGNLGDQIAYVWSLRETVTVKSGGFFGALLGGGMSFLFGKAAAATVLIVLLIGVFVFVTRTSLFGIYVYFQNKAEEIKQIREEESEYDNYRYENENNYNSRKKKLVPDLGPDPYEEDSGMQIDELVGNAKKKPVNNTKKAPKLFVDVDTGEVVDNNVATEIIPLDDIIKNANKGVTEKPTENKAPKIEKKKEEKKEKAEEPVQVFHTYQKPNIDCLEYANNKGAMNYEEELKMNAKKLVDTLNSFGVSAKIVDICRGPSVTRYELQPAAGVKISKITSLSDDIALALASSGVRIEAPIPNKSAIGIEVPNKNRSTVSLREIIETPVYQNAKSKLNVGLGKDITGNTICADIAKMPHLLIAGTTGSGKSVCLNSMIISLLYNADPDEVKLLMIDPKQVEFTVYNGIPHLLVPVVSDPRKAAGALGWAVAEMLQRYKMFSEKSVRDIKGYNKMAANDPEMAPMPQIVIFIDELSDLMMAAPNEVEDSICRLAQMARAAGMHLVIATQRPSVNVITGIIKANIPSRIALSVSSQIDSRTIIDAVGAEKLLGNGDMLFSPVGNSKPVRVQGCFLSDEEVENVVKFIKSQSDGESAKYDEEINSEIERLAVVEPKKSSSAVSSSDASSEGGDEMIPKAIEVVVEAQMASTTLLQRKLKLGYARAARIMDELEERKIVGPFEGSKPRKVLVSKQQWMEMNALATASAPIENPLETDADDEY